MDKIIKIYKEIMTGIGIVGLVGFIASVLIQVVSRTFLPTAPNWTEEAARFLFIYMVAFAGNAAVLNDEYVNVEMLVEKLPKSLQKMLNLAIAAVLCVFAGFIHQMRDGSQGAPGSDASRHGFHGSDHSHAIYLCC